MARRSNRKNAGNKLSQVLAAVNSTDVTPPTSIDATLIPLPESVSCKCGVTFDDKKHMVQCDKCLSWAHSGCYGLSLEDAALFDFICDDCRASGEPPVIGPAEPRPCSDESAAEPRPGVNLGSSPASSPNTSCLCCNELLASLRALEQRTLSLEQLVQDTRVQSKNDLKPLQRQILDLEAEVLSLQQDAHGSRPQRPKSKRASTSTSFHSRISVSKPIKSSHSSFRIIWGTHKECSVEDVRVALTPIIANSNTNISISRSLRRLGKRLSWWFTISANEPALLSLDQNWCQLEKCNWSLIKALRDRPHETPKVPHGSATPSAGQVFSAPPSTEAYHGSHLGPSSNPHLPVTPLSGQETSAQCCSNIPPLSEKFPIIWGTSRRTTVDEIRRTISRIVPDCANSVLIKHSSRSTPRGTIWWFTLIAHHHVLTSIGGKWEQFRPDPRWILLSQLKDRPRQSSLAKQIPSQAHPSNPPLPSQQPTSPTPHSLSPKHPSSQSQFTAPPVVAQNISLPSCSTQVPPQHSASASQLLSQPPISIQLPPQLDSMRQAISTHYAPSSQPLHQSTFSQTQVPISAHPASLPFLGVGQGATTGPPPPWFPSHPQLLVMAPPPFLPRNVVPLNQPCSAAPHFLSPHHVTPTPTSHPQM